jgi:hypothetical protein
VTPQLNRRAGLRWQGERAADGGVPANHVMDGATLAWLLIETASIGQSFEQARCGHVDSEDAVIVLQIITEIFGTERRFSTLSP